MRVLAIRFFSDVELQKLGDILYRYSPQVALREPHVLFLEISKSHRIYSEDGILLRVKVHLQQLGIKSSIAIADDVPTALSMAESGVQNKNQLPIESIKNYASPFKSDLFLEQKAIEMITHLKNLGVQNLGDFQKIKLHSWIARFGSFGRWIFQNVQDSSGLIWPNFAPSEKIEENFEFDPEYPVESTEPLLFQMRSMLDQIGLRLRGQGKRLKRLLLILNYEHKAQDGSKDYRMEIALANGIMTSKSIFSILQENLQRSVQVKPLTHRVNALALEVRETTPYFESQRDLLNPKKEEEEESLSHLLSRLRVRLGERSVFSAELIASYIPELNWVRSPTAKPALLKQDFPLRPLKVFSAPEKLLQRNGHLYWQNQKIEGPTDQYQEIVFSEWWNGIGERFYYQVKSSQGLDLWLFQQESEYFLHGVFD